MDARLLRSRTLLICEGWGIAISDALPLLDSDMSLRSKDEVVDRLLCLNACVAFAFGLDREKASDWLSREGLEESLAPEEKRLLSGERLDLEQFQLQVDAIWALVWALRMGDVLDFQTPVPSDLVHRLPDLKSGEDSSGLRRRATLRSLEEVAYKCDLAYCLHWALRESALGASALSRPLDYHLVEERRRALDWLVSDESWEDLSLDT